jgi:hypothetical protein
MGNLKVMLAGLAGAAVAVAGIGFGALSLHTADAQPSEASCTGQFQIRTVSASDAREISTAGQLALQIGGSGDVNGTLQTADGSVAHVFGQVNGRSLGLAIETDSGNVYYGVGVAQNDIRSCNGLMAGPGASESNVSGETLGARSIGNGAWVFNAYGQ